MEGLRKEAKDNRVLAADLKEKYGDVDLEEIIKLKADADALKVEADAAELERRLKEGQIDQLISEARDEGKVAFTAKETEYLTEIDKVKAEMVTLEKVNEGLVYSKAFSDGLQEAALTVTDALGLNLRIEREQSIVVAEDGKKTIVLKDYETGDVFTDESGKPLTMAGRIKQFHDDPITAYMFGSSRKGAGSSTSEGGDGGQGGGGSKTVEDIDYFTVDSAHYNVTEQQKIYTENKTLYEKLRKQALEAATQMI